MFIIVTIFFYYDIIAKTSVENWLGKYFIWDSFSYWASYREITGVRDRILWQLFSAKFSPYVARSEWVIENQSITGQRRISFWRVSSFLWEINDLPRFKLCYLWRKKRSFYQDNVVSVFDTFRREWSISTSRYIFTTCAGIFKDSYILYPLPWTSEHSNQFHPLAVCDKLII